MSRIPLFLSSLHPNPATELIMQNMYFKQIAIHSHIFAQTSANNSLR